MKDGFGRRCSPSPRPGPLPPAHHAVTRRRVLATLGAAPLGVALGACGSTSRVDETPRVVVGCFGIEGMARAVAGTAAHVVNLAKPGQEPHDVELSIAETAALEKAAVIVQIPGFQSALDDVVAARSLRRTVLDVSTVLPLLPATGSEHEEHHASDSASLAQRASGDSPSAQSPSTVDPHFWLDPTLLARLAGALATRLGAIVPASAGEFTANARAVSERLAALDEELTAAYGSVGGERVFVTGHAAFSYLARRYGLTQVSISGIDPEAEPSPQRLLSLRSVISERRVSTVFFEESASPKVARTLAANAGVRAEALDDLETQLDPRKDYFAVMREDAQTLMESWS